MVVKKKKKMGRPKIECEWEPLKKSFKEKDLALLCLYNIELSHCAELLNVSEDTIERRIREEKNMTFAEYRHKKMAQTCFKLAKTIVDMAIEDRNPAAVIFLNKNFNRMQDTVPARLEPIEDLTFDD